MKPPSLSFHPFLFHQGLTWTAVKAPSADRILSVGFRIERNFGQQQIGIFQSLRRFPDHQAPLLGKFSSYYSRLRFVNREGFGVNFVYSPATSPEMVIEI